MGDSANLALYSIVRERGLIPDRRLKEALEEAQRDGRPLEQVLMQKGLLSATVCEHVLQDRAKLACSCQNCAEFSYLVGGRTEQETTCEHCGEPLMGGDAKKPARSRSKPPPIKMRGTGAHRRGAEAPGGSGAPPRPATSRPAARSGAPRRPAPARPPTPARRGGVVQGRLDETKAAEAINKLVEMVEKRLTTAEALGRFATLATEHALSSVAEKLEDQYLGALPARISEEVTARVLETVERRMGKDTLPKISQKVTRHALQAVEKRLEAEDLAGLAARIQEDTRQEVERNLDTMRAEAVLAAVQAPPREGADDQVEGGSPVDAQALDSIGARVGQIEEQLAGLDPAELPERVTERALEGFWSRLENAGLEGLPPRVVEELLDRAGSRPSAEGEGSAPASTAGVDQDAIVAHALDSMWSHLEEHGVAGFPARVLDETVARAVGALQDAGSALSGGGDLTGRIEALETSLLDMGTSVGEVDSGSRLDLLEEAIKRLDSRRAEEGSADAPQGEGGSVWEVPFDALAGRVRHLEDRADGGAELPGGGDADLAARVAGLEAALQGWSPGGGGDSDVAGRLELLEQGDSTRRLSLLEQQVSRSGASSGEADAAITSLTRRLSALEGGRNLDPGSGSELVPPLDEDQGDRLATLEQRLAGIQEQLERLGAASDSGDVPAAVEELSASLAQVLGRLAQLEESSGGDNAGGDNAGGDLNSRLEELESRQGVALEALVARVEQLEAGRSSELAGQVASLSQRVETLVPSEPFMNLLKRVTQLEGNTVAGGDLLDSRVAALEDVSEGEDTETLLRRLQKVERNLVELELGSAGGGALERLEALEQSVASGDQPAGGAADPALAEQLLALERRLGEFEMGAGSGTGAVEEIEALRAKVSLLEERSGEGSGPQTAFSEEFVDQVVQLALEQVRDRSEAGDDERVVRRILEQLEPQLEERLQGAQTSGPADWEGEVERRVTSEVEEQLAMADLSSLGEQATASAMEAVQAHLAQVADPGALSQQADAALRDALEGLDVGQLSERVAMQAVGPVMEAIDGRLQDVSSGDLRATIETLQKRLDVLEQGGYA